MELRCAKKKIKPILQPKIDCKLIRGQQKSRGGLNALKLEGPEGPEGPEGRSGFPALKGQRAVLENVICALF